MSLENELMTRSGSTCELCSSPENLSVYLVPPGQLESVDKAVLACKTCQEQLDGSEKIEPNHWRCLNDSMWSSVPAVQALAWRMLYRMRLEGWPQDLLDMMYLEEDTLAWAKETEQEEEGAVVHKDSNGVVLNSGDSVVIIKDLNVKGTSFTAKRGTTVRNISLVHDNKDQIEGKVNGQQIVLLTQYLKKT